MLAWLLGTFSLNLQAATLTWDAIEAVSDSYHAGGHDHAIWMVGFADPTDSRDWLFQGGSGTFTYDGSSGIASLSGSIFNQSHAGLTGDIVFSFAQNPRGSPKQELKSNAYSENGGLVDTSVWQYFDSASGSFVGTGQLSGLSVEYTQRPAYAPWDRNRHRGQFGIGASGKNVDPGFSSWFWWDVTGCRNGIDNGCESLGLTLSSGNVGDININVIPVPTGFWLFGSTLVGFVALRRGSSADQTKDTGFVNHV